MSHSQKIRERAAELRAEITKNETSLGDAAELIDAALDHFGLCLSPEHRNSANLRDALAVLEDVVVFFDNDLKGWYKNYCIAHEIGHFVLHRESVHCSADDIESFDADDEQPSATAKVAGYGPHERREREANLFALEFLLPSNVLRRLLIDEKMPASAIADASGFPLDVVHGQIARAVLLPPTPAAEVAETTDFELDESQRAAAEAEVGPLLVAAGPGTGKTATLVRRIIFLLDRGVAPEKILALTFSNKAAEEMRERVARKRPDDARRIPVMTFHSFALDLLRRYWREAGLDKDSKLIEKIDAIFYLEDKLLDLRLDHFQSLHEPAANFPALLGAISRAKDELVAPDGYRRLGERMRDAAASEDDQAKAAKVLETARVYEVYQQWLDESKLLDFGDLIFRTVRLLQSNAGVAAAVRGLYEHVLVDEFQDVNRASGVLLREVAGAGAGLWAVGDLRQSIYRWRGASPANIQLFHEDFPNGQTLALAGNYRSGRSIVAAFANFARAMKAGGGFFADWRPQTEDFGEISYTVAATLDDEVAKIASEIAASVAQRGSFRDHAIICRTHRQLVSVADRLTARGVPVLYLGDVFERDEVRDLLALLELRAAPNGFSLVRAAQIPEYSIPPDDVRTIVEAAGREDSDIRAAMFDDELLATLSGEGREGARRLRSHLFDADANVSAWRFCCDYLFETSGYLRRELEDESVAAAQKRLALFQFLSFAQAQEDRFRSKGQAQTAAFLSHVRKLARLNEDRDFAQIPASAAHLDAVRLLTVHAAKGLEFDNVYLPFMATSQFPSSRQGSVCPTPDGLSVLAGDYHDEEEECLFFVAASRARKRLCLSRNESRNKPSRFLEMLGSLLPEPFPAPATEPFDERVARVDYAQNHFHVSQLKRFEECPRQFYYRDVLKMKENDESSVYRKFHGAVYGALRELGGASGDSGAAAERVRAKFAALWTESAIDEHPYAPIYRAEAESMIEELCSAVEKSVGGVPDDSLVAEFPNGRVFVNANLLEISENHVNIRNFRARKSPRTSEGKAATVTDDEFLLHFAVAGKYSGRGVTLENHYLKDGAVREVGVTSRIVSNRTAKIAASIDAINRGEFAAKPNDRTCPSCAFYFICPK